MLIAEFVEYVAYGLIFFSVFTFSSWLIKEQSALQTAENLQNNSKTSKNFLVRILKPFFSQYISPFIRIRSFWDPLRLQYRRNLISAGLKDELTADEVIAFQMTLLIFFPIIYIGLYLLDLLDFSWIYMLVSAVSGLIYPYFWIQYEMQTRKQLVLKSLPFVVDLLALCTEAGLDFIGAISRVVQKAVPSPLVDELTQVLREIQVGASRKEALREMAVRLSIQEVNSFIAILISSDELGSPIGAVLRQQSEQVRIDRLTRAEKEAAKAMTKISLINAGILFPTVVLVALAPAIVGGGFNF